MVRENLDSSEVLGYRRCFGGTCAVIVYATLLFGRDTIAELPGAQCLVAVFDLTPGPVLAVAMNLAIPSQPDP